MFVLTPAHLVVCLTSQRILCKVFICRRVQPFTQSDHLFTPLITQIYTDFVSALDQNEVGLLEECVTHYSLQNGLYDISSWVVTNKGHVKTVCLHLHNVSHRSRVNPCSFTRHFPPNLHVKCLHEWRQMRSLNPLKRKRRKPFGCFSSLVNTETSSSCALVSVGTGFNAVQFNFWFCEEWQMWQYLILSVHL